MKKDAMFFYILLFILAVVAYSIETQSYEELESKLDHINNQIISHRMMGFLNYNFNNNSLHVSIFPSSNIFNKMKIRRFTTTKIDIGYEIKEIYKLYDKDKNYIPQILQFNPKQRYIYNINFISTVGLTSKKFYGLNFNSHVIFQYFNKFYSLEGYNVFIFRSSDKKEDDRLIKKYLNSAYFEYVLVASSRNENFYIASYYKQRSVRNNGNCLNIKIFHVYLRNKQFLINNKLPYDNLKIETNICDKQYVSETHPYKFFFTSNTYHNKPSHYILANEKYVNFFLYSEIAEQLVMDQNRTIRLMDIWNNNTYTISTIIKLNTHLIILTSSNHLFSVNLMSHLSSKTLNIIIYETVPLQFYKLKSIHFNDNDFRFFHVLSNQNIYLYKLSTYNIVKKYPLKMPICSNINLRKCTYSIWILENYILVQEKLQKRHHHFDYQYFLIDKSSGDWHYFHIPFSHEDKCSDLKRIFVTKNKNSHYIMTLACFMYQRKKTYDMNGLNTYTYASKHLILYHLNLYTSNEINHAGEIGGVDFTKFRVPMILFSIGLVCYITLKRSNKKSPYKIAYEYKVHKKFEYEILSTIRRYKYRQYALNLHRKKG